MAEDRIDSIIDIKAVQAEIDLTKSGINELIALIQSVKGKALDITGAKSVSEVKGLSKELDDLVQKTNKAASESIKFANAQNALADNLGKSGDSAKEAAQDFTKLSTELSTNIKRQIELKNRLAEIKEALGKLNEFREAAKDSAQFNDEILKLSTEEAKLKGELSQTNKLINSQVKEFNAATGSTDELKAKISQLTQVYDSLSKAQKGSSEGKDLLTKIQLLKTELQTSEAVKKSIGAYSQLALRFKIASENAKNLAASYGVMDKRAQAAAKEANGLNDQLKKIDASVGNFQRNVGNYPKGFDKISTSISNLTTNFLSLLGVVGIGSIFSSSIDEFIEMDKNVRLLQNTLKNLGVPEAFGRIEASANSLAKQFKFLDNDEILKSFNQLIVYGKLTEKQINDLIPVIINFSAATGQTLEQATSTIIKSLEGNGKSLKEFGINMKDAKTTTEAFSLVMTELAPKVDGVGKAFGDSAAGGLASAKQEFKDLKEELGGKLLPVLNSIVNFLLGAVKGAVQFKDAIKDLINLTPGKTAALNADLFAAQENTKKFLDELDSLKPTAGARLNAIGNEIAFVNEQLKLAQNYQIKKVDEKTGQIYLGLYTGKNTEKDRQSDINYLSEKIRLLNEQKKALETPVDPNKILGLGQPDSRDADAKKKAEEERKKKEAEEIKAAEERAERIRKAVFETNKSILQDQIKQNEEIFKDDKKSEEERLQALREFVQNKAALVQLERTFEKGTKGILAEEIVTIEQNKTNDINEIVRNGHRDYEKILEDSAKKQQEIEKDNADRIKKIHEDLQKDIDKGLDEANERLKNKLKEREEFEKERGELRKQLANEVEGFLFDIAFNNIDREKNAIQDQIDLLEAKKQKDIEVANATITNAQDRAAAITTIEARANAEKEALERKQRQLDIQRARFEKAQNIASIISETALAVVRTLGAKPWTPANIALAALVGSIGAVQAARAAAQPIPRFKEGGEVKETGLIMVGDGGKHEGVKLPDGTLMKTPNVNTLMYAEKGTKIFPDYNKMMFKATLTDVPKWSSTKTTDTTPMILLGLKSVERTLERSVKRIPQTQFVVDNIISKKVRQG